MDPATYTGENDCGHGRTIAHAATVPPRRPVQPYAKAAAGNDGDLRLSFDDHIG